MGILEKRRMWKIGLTCCITGIVAYILLQPLHVYNGGPDNPVLIWNNNRLYVFTNETIVHSQRSRLMMLLRGFNNTMYYKASRTNMTIYDGIKAVRATVQPPLTCLYLRGTTLYGRNYNGPWMEISNKGDVNAADVSIRLSDITCRRASISVTQDEGADWNVILAHEWNNSGIPKTWDKAIRLNDIDYTVLYTLTLLGMSRTEYAYEVSVKKSAGDNAPIVLYTGKSGLWASWRSKFHDMEFSTDGSPDRLSLFTSEPGTLNGSPNNWK